MDSRTYQIRITVNQQYPVYQTTFTAPPNVQLVKPGWTESRRLNDDPAAFVVLEVADVTGTADEAGVYPYLAGRIDRALALIGKYGGHDGAHHKQWLLNQVARELAGPDYEAWARSVPGGVAEGIAP